MCAAAGWFALVPFVITFAFGMVLVRFRTPRWLGDGNAAALLIFWGCALGGLIVLTRFCPH
ncbi:hypothetical protein [Bradyrhizobium sp. CB2312]|uniref:hypothetical protein n=1 Tax=Bradyrhizobium sp. CB2312 TaxID=3039155 RepID=UPI0024B1363E|nr:hypothetical protein [Bradyrhizobium sp. CB2312]WFU75228.1 hypothetical protein QA642_14985 [Bradyrhizobium sp. CB2312]